MAVVIANQLRKEFAGDPLFDGVSFKVERRDRLSLAGPNGAGKTTLLRMLARELPVEGGELVFSKGTRVALHDQRPPLEQGLTLREYVLSGASDLIALEEELRTLEQAMAAGDHDQATLARYLAGDPDLLLLDEPTNHLDVESIEWLERELQSLDAAVILVAHDRWFLEAVTNGVLELSGGRSLYFKGPWHQWRLEKAARAQHAQKSLDRLGGDIARLERFVERFRYKKTKAKQAQAKLTHIGRLEEERGGQAETLDRLTTRKRSMGFDFLRPARSGRTVVEAAGLAVKAGDKELLDEVDFALERGEHAALVGPNGSGKTTLLETMLGRRDAAAGTVRLGHGVEAAYFSQQELELDERGTVLDCVQGSTGLPRQSAQNLLGRFLFSGWDEQSKPVTVLSGGERRRLALAIVVASGANFLVLDEPTNHLDLESREALEAALEAFPGTVLLARWERLFESSRV